MKNACDFSFGDLYHASNGRRMSDAEAAAFKRLSQAEVNAWVRQQCAASDGRFTYREGMATSLHDGIVYTLFGASEPGDGRKVTIESRLEPPTDRENVETQVARATGEALDAFDRAHARDTGASAEGDRDVRHPPPDVQRALHPQGLASFVRNLFDQKSPEVDLYLVTMIEGHPDTSRPKRLESRIDADRNGKRTPLLEWGFDLGGDLESPPADVRVRRRDGYEAFLTPLTPADLASRRSF